MKKIIMTICCVFCLLMPFTAFANEQPHFIDNSSLVTEREADEINSNLEQLSDELQFDIVAVTINGTDGKSIEAYADDYYDEHNYGYGENKDGCLLVVDMNNQEWHLSTAGKGINYSDSLILSLETNIVPELSEGEYYAAFVQYGTDVKYVLKNSVPRDKPLGYETDTTSKNPVKIIVIGLVAGNVIALIVVFALKGQLKSVKAKNEAHNYITNARVTNQRDIFLYKNVTRTRRQTENSHSSSHISSSGTRHGGGGGRF